MLRGKLFDDLTFGPARRRRQMHRRLRELDRLYATGSGPDGFPARPVQVRRTSERMRTVLVAVATAALVSGWVVFSYDNPLGRPPHVAEGVGTFRFTAHQPGDAERPVAYDPCHPVPIVVNDTDAPDGAEPILRSALKEVSAATGLVLELTGRTDERLGGTRHQVGPRTLPVVVDWTSPDRVGGLAGNVAGLAGSSAVQTPTGELRYTTGSVALDAADLTRILQRRDGEAQVRAIIIHELGHLVGLDHVDDPNELMHDENLGLTELGPGDREGLALLGAGRCFPGL
ncbi:MAG TPA: matrixin family metalloprotease [Nocardioidaceae bacterium]|nr:matrixin family metalloprotease [Nocardioidaceae bacterium]